MPGAPEILACLEQLLSTYLKCLEFEASVEKRCAAALRIVVDERELTRFILQSDEKTAGIVAKAVVAAREALERGDPETTRAAIELVKRLRARLAR